VCFRDISQAALLVPVMLHCSDSGWQMNGETHSHTRALVMILMRTHKNNAATRLIREEEYSSIVYTREDTVT
jgi:hypothetical protein